MRLIIMKGETEADWMDGVKEKENWWSTGRRCTVLGTQILGENHIGV